MVQWPQTNEEKGPSVSRFNRRILLPIPLISLVASASLSFKQPMEQCSRRGGVHSISLAIILAPIPVGWRKRGGQSAEGPVLSDYSHLHPLTSGWFILQINDLGFGLFLSCGGLQGGTDALHQVLEQISSSLLSLACVSQSASQSVFPYLGFQKL
jgi:hypothetical protein